jgi:hypothetical protein
MNSLEELKSPSSYPLIEQHLLDMLKPSEDDLKVRHPQLSISSKYLIEQ